LLRYIGSLVRRKDISYPQTSIFLIQNSLKFCYNISMRGFTLIEIIVYVAILAIILSFISGFIFNGVNSSSKIQAWQEVSDNGRFVENKILEAVQSSQGVN